MGLRYQLENLNWLSAPMTMVLSFHPTKPMKPQAIYANMKKLGWEGSYVYCRKTLSYYPNLFINPGYATWALTAKGQTLRNKVIQDMQEVLGLVWRQKWSDVADETLAAAHADHL